MRASVNKDKASTDIRSSVRSSAHLAHVRALDHIPDDLEQDAGGEDVDIRREEGADPDHAARDVGVLASNQVSQQSPPDECQLTSCIKYRNRLKYHLSHAPFSSVSPLHGVVVANA